MLGLHILFCRARREGSTVHSIVDRSEGRNPWFEYFSACFLVNALFYVDYLQSSGTVDRRGSDPLGAFLLLQRTFR